MDEKATEIRLQYTLNICIMLQLLYIKDKLINKNPNDN